MRISGFIMGLTAASIALSGHSAAADGVEPPKPQPGPHAQTASQGDGPDKGPRTSQQARPDATSHPETLLQLREPQMKRDSRALRLQDMLMVLLLPHMQAKLDEAYADVLKTPPGLYPYYVDVVSTKRMNGFRGFILRIVLDAIPTVGPHIAVGEDRFTFEISPSAGVKLIRYEHVKGPDPNHFPPNYKDLLK